MALREPGFEAVEQLGFAAGAKMVDDVYVALAKETPGPQPDAAIHARSRRG